MREARETQTLFDELERIVKEQDEQIETLHRQIEHLVAEARLVKPEQEPVAWQNLELPDEFYEYEHLDPMWHHHYRPLYTTPPRKPWVGLTDEDIKGILDCDRGWMADIKKAEQILKDKNT
jgi:hypothetical protein